MKRITIAALALTLVTSVAVLTAQETRPAKMDMAQMPEMPGPQKEHEWLKQFVGQWTTEFEMNMPDMPPMKCTGKESVRSVGEFWILSEGKGDMMGMPMQMVMALGYDPDRGKYVGTLLDSMSSYMWHYKGTVDASGKKLTLETEGPCPMKPGKISKFKETIEIKSPDHRVFTSTMQDDNGEWIQVGVGNFHRVK